MSSLRWAAPSNKELKLTKPSILELRSLTPVLGRPDAGARETGSSGCQNRSDGLSKYL